MNEKAHKIEDLARTQKINKFGTGDRPPDQELAELIAAGYPEWFETLNFILARVALKPNTAFTGKKLLPFAVKRSLNIGDIALRSLHFAPCANIGCDLFAPVNTSC